MIGRWFVLAVVGIAVFTYVNQSSDSRAATATVTQACSAKPGAATVTWVWPKPAAGANQTWFDLSLVPGFLPGWFQGYGPLAPTQTAHALDGLPNGLTYYYRVNTLYPTGWKETASGTFIVNCNDGGGGGGGAPVTGNVTQTCAGNSVTVTFNWQPKATGWQFIDLTVFNNGFAPGTFVGAGPVSGGSFTWYGIAKGVTHYWRVNTLTPSGWVGSNTGSFTSSSCLPPEKACVGYMAGYSAAGRGECDQIMNGGNVALGNCVRYILKIPVADGKSACVTAAVSAGGYLSDCLLGLSGQSHFGLTSCKFYYGGG